MTIDEIAEQLHEALTATTRGEVISQCNTLQCCLGDAIAERSMPVTRKLCRSLGANLIGEHYAVWEWIDESHGVPMRLRLHSDGDAFLLGTTYIRRCKTMGQLIDLLSGLGVRK